MPTSAPVAILTGASSGIGEATAPALARAGFRVVVAARRADRLEALAKSLAPEGHALLPIPVDLADGGQTRALVRQTLDAWGRIDLLVNNAGYSPAAALEQLSRDELRHTFDVNLVSQLQLVGEVVPVMRAQGGGRIVNIGSLAGNVQAPLAVPYAATKAGIEAACGGLRLELAPWKIHVSLVVAGFVDTPVFDTSRAMYEHLRSDPDNPYRQLMFDLDDFAQKQIRRALAPEDVARVIVSAATARRPRGVYHAPRSAAFQKAFMALLPTRLRDEILLRMYKAPRG